MTPEPVALAARGLSAFYGKSQALFDVDLDVHQGEALAVVGRNGAGKTTLLHTLMGLLPRRSGSVRLGETDISAWPAHRRGRAGLAYVPAGARLFRSLTVRENLRVAAVTTSGMAVEDALRLFPQAEAIAERQAGALSGGERQMVGIARAMVTGPSILVLDEPTEGLSPLVVGTVCELLSGLAARGVTLLLCEQNTRVVDAVADRALVLEKGRVIADDPADARGYREHLGV